MQRYSDKSIPRTLVKKRDNFEYGFQKDKVPTYQLPNTSDIWQYVPPAPRTDCMSASEILNSVGTSISEYSFLGSKYAKVSIQDDVNYRYTESSESDEDRYNLRFPSREKANCEKGIKTDKPPPHQQSTTTEIWQSHPQDLPSNCISESNIIGLLTNSPREDSVHDSKKSRKFEEVEVFFATMEDGNANVTTNETHRPLLMRMEPVAPLPAGDEDKNIGKGVALARREKCFVESEPLFINSGFKTMFPGEVDTKVLSYQPKVDQNKVEEDIIDFLKFDIDEIDQHKEEEKVDRGKKES